jgi:hypothetical protein
MTPERKSILDSLGAVVAEKRARFQGLGMMNVAGLSEVERARRSMEYSQAQADLLNAENALRGELARKEPQQ